MKKKKESCLANLGSRGRMREREWGRNTAALRPLPPLPGQPIASPQSTATFSICEAWATHAHTCLMEGELINNGQRHRVFLKKRLTGRTLISNLKLSQRYFHSGNVHIKTRIALIQQMLKPNDNSCSKHQNSTSSIMPNSITVITAHLWG